MPVKALARKPGPPAKPKTRLEAQLASAESQIRPARRRVSGKGRKFVDLFAKSGFKDTQGSATGAGYKEPGIGDRLVGKYAELIEAERLRTAVQEQMELDEALRLTAQLGRTADRDVDRLQALRTILQVHGVLSDKPLPAVDRRSIARQIAETIERIQRTASTSPGARVKVRAMVGASIEASVEPSVPPAEQTVDVSVSELSDAPAPAIPPTQPE